MKLGFGNSCSALSQRISLKLRGKLLLKNTVPYLPSHFHLTFQHCQPQPAQSSQFTKKLWPFLSPPGAAYLSLDLSPLFPFFNVRSKMPLQTQDTCFSATLSIYPWPCNPADCGMSPQEGYLSMQVPALGENCTGCLPHGILRGLPLAVPATLSNSVFRSRDNCQVIHYSQGTFFLRKKCRCLIFMILFHQRLLSCCHGHGT